MIKKKEIRRLGFTPLGKEARKGPKQRKAEARAKARSKAKSRRKNIRIARRVWRKLV